MGRINRRYMTSVSLGASTDITTMPEITVGRDGYVALQVLIDNGAGAAPSDAPAGTWEIWASAGSRFTQVTGTTITTELAKVAPNANNVVDAWAILVGVPGSRFKLRYNRTSGGTTNARATVDVSSW